MGLVSYPKTPKRFGVVPFILMVGVVAACAVPPPAVFTWRVPDPSPGQTVPAQLVPTPRPDLSGVAYGPSPHQLADVFLPNEGGNRGAIIAVHGGGFTAGSRADVAHIFGPILAQRRRGFSIIAVSYGLASRHANLFPTAVNDVATAVSWVRSEGSRIGVNPSVVILAGHSAGGTIAALIALGANSTSLGVIPSVDGWISAGAIYDFTTNNSRINGFGRDWLGPAWFGPARHIASPVTHLDPADPPGYAIHGNLDNVVHSSQFTQFVETAAGRGITDRLYVDYVDTVAAEPTQVKAADCRWHFPLCGANAEVLANWVDAVSAGSFL